MKRKIDWPKDGSPIDLSDLMVVLERAAKQVCNLKKDAGTRDIEWDGPDKIPSVSHVSANPVYMLSQKGIERSDRSALNAVLTLAFQLGIEQGIRIQKSQHKKYSLLILTQIELLLKKSGKPLTKKGCSEIEELLKELLE